MKAKTPSNFKILRLFGQLNYNHLHHNSVFRKRIALSFTRRKITPSIPRRRIALSSTRRRIALNFIRRKIAFISIRIALYLMKERLRMEIQIILVNIVVLKKCLQELTKFTIALLLTICNLIRTCINLSNIVIINKIRLFIIQNKLILLMIYHSKIFAMKRKHKIINLQH